MAPTKELKGIGGWLLLLCLSLSVFTPLALLVAGVASTRAAIAALDHFPVFAWLLLGAQMLNFALLGYCVWAGISLWMEKKEAVWRAQKFLIVYILFLVARVFLPYASDLTVMVREDVVAAYSRAAVQGFAYALVWYLYLEKSVRVRNTCIR